MRCFINLFFLFFLTVASWTNAASADFKAHFENMASDPRPDKITRGSHYVVSNESNHHIFRQHVADKGGIFVGVGGDQLYIISGWMKPEILIPMDFDQYIVDLHNIYGLMFKKADNPKDFLDLWKQKNEKTIIADIKAQFPENAKQYVKVFKFARKTVFWRLRKTRKQYKKLKIPIFLTDQDTYTTVSNLHREGRVFPLRGDLTKDKAMNAISQASKSANIPVRAIYLSNAEQYFRYGDDYRSNFINMNFDSESLILRTLPKLPDYYYYVQKAELFQRYLQQPHIKKVWSITRLKRRMRNTDGLGFWLDKEPPPKKKRKKRKKRKTKK